jgi:hypothetical protein
MRYRLLLIWKQTTIVKTILSLGKLRFPTGIASALCMTLKLAEIYENVKKMPFFSTLLRTHQLAKEAKRESSNDLHTMECVWVCDLASACPFRYE